MNNANIRKGLNGEEWGNFRYDAKTDILYWKDEDDASWDKDEDGELRIRYKNNPPYGDPYHIDHDHYTVEDALRWIAHFAVTKKRQITEKDLKDLAQAFSEIIECPQLASAYQTTYANLDETNSKLKSISNPVCNKCNNRFGCFTN